MSLHWNIETDEVDTLFQNKFRLLSTSLVHFLWLVKKRVNYQFLTSRVLPAKTNVPFKLNSSINFWIKIEKMKLTCVLALCSLLVLALVISTNGADKPGFDPWGWDKRCESKKIVSICRNCKAGPLNYQWRKLTLLLTLFLSGTAFQRLHCKSPCRWYDRYAKDKYGMEYLLNGYCKMNANNVIPRPPPNITE